MKQWINRIEFFVAGCAMSIAVLATAANVVLRYCFNRPIYQAEEIATSMFVWLVFIGAAACYGEKCHIGIDCLVVLLPKKLRKAIEIITSGFMIVLLIVMTYMSIAFTSNAGSKLTAILRVPYSWIDAAAVIGFAFMLLHAIDFFIQNIRSYRTADIDKKGEF